MEHCTKLKYSKKSTGNQRIMQREKAGVILLQNIKDIAETEVDGLIKSN